VGELAGKPLHIGEAAQIEFDDVGEVLRGQPKAVACRGVPGDDDDAIPGDSTQLGQAGVQIIPVVQRENSERRIEGLVRERQCSATAWMAGAARGGRCLSIA
jgi:hypothetical protein